MPERRVHIDIPATFAAVAIVQVLPDGSPGEVRIDHFSVSPLESYAGYFGPDAAASEVTDESGEWETGAADSPAAKVFGKAAEDYWKACNDGTWPLDRIDWDE